MIIYLSYIHTVSAWSINLQVREQINDSDCIKNEAFMKNIIIIKLVK